MLKLEKARVEEHANGADDADRCCSAFQLLNHAIVVGQHDCRTHGKPLPDKLKSPNLLHPHFRRCGCVYTLDLDPSYNAVNMYGLTCGIPDVGVTPVRKRV